MENTKDTQNTKDRKENLGESPRILSLRGKASALPLSPGVYLMKDKNENIIYIGKAKALKNRVSSYFAKTHHNIKTTKLVEKIHTFDYIITFSELDALVLEASLIKQHAPKYNILLKDSKGFNYVKISHGDYPRVTYSNDNSDKSAKYIGPFTSGFTVKTAIEDANKIFRLPSCSLKFPRDFKKSRPCLNHQIGRCMGVCTGEISKDDYNQIVLDTVDYIKKGNKESIIRWAADMMYYSKNLEFERAATLRDRIEAIKKIAAGEKITSSDVGTFYVISTFAERGKAAVAVIKYSGGFLVEKHGFFVGDECEPDEIIKEFLPRYFHHRIVEKEFTPPTLPTVLRRTAPERERVYINVELDEKGLYETLLNLKLVVPKRGERLTQLTLATANARECLYTHIPRQTRDEETLETLKNLLNLKTTPNYIECYDISNIGETTKVGGMVVFKNAKPFKKAYRRFSIKSVDGIDDYSSMEEMLRRRFTRYKEGLTELSPENEQPEQPDQPDQSTTGDKQGNDNNDGNNNNNNDAFKTLPDLILIDGGEGHVSTAKKVLDSLSLNIPVFGLVKDTKHKTRAIAATGGEIEINKTKSIFTFLTGIQDEVHRFAVAYAWGKHKETSFDLMFVAVPGIGKVKTALLLKTFKTRDELKSATTEQLAKAANLSPQKAQELFAFIKKNV